MVKGSKHLPVLDLVDRSDRAVTYLRVSLTDRCNYRCTYCMPEEGISLLPQKNILTFEEIERLCRIFSGIGVRRIRLTGGEPTIRKHVTALVEKIAGIDGIDDVVMTTNGHRLPELAGDLAVAGLKGVNISIDTLDAERFRSLTRRGSLERVLMGVDAAVEAGLTVKLNTVLLRDQNQDELGNICEYAWSKGALPRFIEHMPMSSGEIYNSAQLLSAKEVRQRIGEQFGENVEASPADLSNRRENKGPARYFFLKDSGRRFGIISAMTDHFCGTCNRVRLSATGDLHNCLAYDDSNSLRQLLRAGKSDEDVLQAIRDSVGLKRDGHTFAQNGTGGPRKHMISIGG